MRVILAGLFVWVGVYAALAVVSHMFGDRVPGPIVGVGLGLVMLVLMAIALVAFNYQRLPAVPEGDYVRDLESRGMLTSTEFKAVRAFEVEEYEDEGLHYFLELEDGSVLYLSGQDLYDYLETDDDLETPLARRFPCTEFTVKRHREKGFMVDLVCGGEVLEPEVMAPHFTDKDFKRDLVPADGDVIRDETYDQIKHRLLRNQ